MQHTEWFIVSVSFAILFEAHLSKLIIECFHGAVVIISLLCLRAQSRNSPGLALLNSTHSFILIFLCFSRHQGEMLQQIEVMHILPFPD